MKTKEVRKLIGGSSSKSHNFRSHPGLVLGATSTAIGVSGFVFSQINEHFFKDTESDNVSGFIYFWGISMLIGYFAGSIVLGPINPETEKEPVEAEETPLLGEENASLQQKQDISGKALLTNPYAIAVFCTLFMSLGLGYVYLANLGQILLALSPTAGSAGSAGSAQHLRNVHVSLFSGVNCSSRVIFGFLSDLLKRRYGIHRIWTMWFCVILLLATLVYLTTAVVTQEALILGTSLMGIVYGLAFGVTPAAISEFGRKVFARNWGWMLYAPAIGSQTFSIVFGILYDAEAQREGADVCYGVGCFRSTFTVGIVCTLLCLLLVSWAIVRGKLYKREDRYV
ncbi:hypothetical protein EC973_008718 [Apophysomyces ossiformis]|uniref:NFD4 C-terminal domain-containing protein n=1 Tax=Apophysomyces ossiformis TaxID=679940 RepID=A0A8H7EPL2_9FUNG|nr:hypothetical protein EC973_008718 [Apophysomyces ossiformis]